tara:strand:+ start:283 stop:759 length:477 start_codon:yes stop_codon:yes gene_type:complete
MLETKKELDNFGKRVIKLAKINLGASRKGRVIDSSGTLRKSLSYDLKVFKTGNFRFSIDMEDYGENVDQGRRKGSQPPTAPILKWIKKKPIRLRDLKTGSFVKQTESKLKGLAFAIARKIKREGIKETLFLTEPFEKEFKKLSTELVDAFALDINKLL